MARAHGAVRIISLVLALVGAPTFAARCTPTTFMRDSMFLTAAQIGGDVTGPLDATGCDIGVYYAPGTSAAAT